MKRSFKDLSAAEVLALAISLEEEDARIFQEFARRLRPNYPKAADDLEAMRKEEDSHRHRLGGVVSAALRRGDSVDAAAGRAGLRAPRSAAIGAALGRSAGPPPGGADGIGDPAVLHPGGRADHATPNCGNSWATWPKRSGGTRCSPASSIRPISRKMSTRPRPKRPGNCSCSKWFSRAWSG